MTSPDTAVSWPSVRAALAHAPALVAVMTGPEHHLNYTNDAYRRAFGPRPSSAPARKWLDAVYTTGVPDSHRVRHFSFTYTPLRDADGAITGVLAVGIDESAQLPPASSSSMALQHSLLPHALHQPDELQVAARYRAGTAGTVAGNAAGTEAGGDWYDVIPLAAGRTALVIGDVMGRGLAAAAVMEHLRSALRAYARLDLPPAEVLGLLDALVSDLHPVQIATCLYATFDPADSQLCYASAGHPPPLLRRSDGTVRRLPSQPGAPLGVLAGPFPVRQVQLPAGATLLMYTDGLVERRGQDIEIGITALVEALSGDDLPLEELADLALQQGGPSDGEGDVALLLARSVPATQAGFPERSMRLELNSGDEPARRARAYVNGVLSAWRLPQPLRDDIVTVVGELVVNAVLHSGVAQELRLRRTRHKIVLEVLDQSPRPPKPRPADVKAENGRGLHLVAQLADRWGARPLESGKSVWCEFLA